MMFATHFSNTLYSLVTLLFSEEEGVEGGFDWGADDADGEEAAPLGDEGLVGEEEEEDGLFPPVEDEEE